MTTEHQTILTAPAPAGLEQRIIARLHALRARQQRLRMAAHAITAFVSGTAAVMACMSMLQSISESGMYRYLSLVFSDTAALAQYWREFAYAVMASAPIAGLAIGLLALAVFAWSLSKTLKDINFNSKKLWI